MLDGWQNSIGVQREIEYTERMAYQFPLYILMLTTRRKMSRNIEVDILKLKFEIDSVKERVRDVEENENGKDIENDARQKALDKLRHLQKNTII